MQRVFHANRAYKQYKAYQADLDDSDDDEGPENDDAWLFEDLTVMMKLMMRKREKEQLLALIFEVRTSLAGHDRLLTNFTGLDSRAVEGHYHHLLLATGNRVQGCQYRRLVERSSKLYQRSDQDRRGR